MTNTGSLILVSGRLRTIEKPKERVKKNDLKENDFPKKVTWRGNVCNAITCPSMIKDKSSPPKKNRTPRKQREESRRKEKTERKSRKKPEKVEKSRKESRKKKKGEIKYFLYLMMGDSREDLVPSYKDIEAAYRKPPKRRPKS